MLIMKGIYTNYLEFYITHFIDMKLDINILLERLEFRITRNINNVEYDIFKTDFKNLLKSLTDNELILFNILISGSRKIRDKYIIYIYDTDGNNRDLLPVYHSCSIQMDIKYNSFKRHYLRNKEKFVRSLNIVKNSGFGLA
jgi:hypothetical protein